MDRIWDYIAFELQNNIAAGRAVDAIMDTIGQLELYAECGTPLSSVADVESDYRFLVSGNYLIFYRTYGSEVYIDRILYGKSDFLRVLFGDVLQDTTE